MRAGARSRPMAQRLRIASPSRPQRYIPETGREAAAMVGCINHSLRFGWVGKLPSPQLAAASGALPARPIGTSAKLSRAVAGGSRHPSPAGQAVGDGLPTDRATPADAGNDGTPCARFRSGTIERPAGQARMSGARPHARLVSTVWTWSDKALDRPVRSASSAQPHRADRLNWRTASACRPAAVPARSPTVVSGMAGGRS